MNKFVRSNADILRAGIFKVNSIGLEAYELLVEEKLQSTSCLVLGACLLFFAENITSRDAMLGGTFPPLQI